MTSLTKLRMKQYQSSNYRSNENSPLTGNSLVTPTMRLSGASEVRANVIP